MSISDIEFLHGAAFIRLLKGTSNISISYLPSIHPSFYLIKSSNKEAAILFKISKKPNSSWSFSFSYQEEIALAKFHKLYTGIQLFIAFICHRDAICCLSEEQLWKILNHSNGLAN
jgi:hypothetical protein